MRIAGIAVLLALLTTTGLDAQRRHPISGRVLAPVMGVGGAGWLERPEREDEEAPSKALDALDLKPGMVVADIGAGSGYYSLRLAKRVGASGRVYATDIQQGMIDILNRRIVSGGIENITTVLGGTDDPKLPPRSLDLAIMVDVYHELSQPQAMLRHLREALRAGGRLVLLEYRKEDPTVPIKPEHKMSVAEAKMEVEAEGFTLVKVDEALPRQHILIFTAKPQP